MKLKFIERIKFSLSGRAVPVLRVSESDWETGMIKTIQDLGTCRDRNNSIVQTWDNRGWEKAEEANPITYINEKGLATMCWIVSDRGQTVNLYTQPWKGPNLESVIGKAATVDDIAVAMDLNPSMRDKILFMIIGIFMGWLIVGPMISSIMR